MNFELLNLSVAQAAQRNTGALVVLLPEGWTASKSPFDAWIAEAIAANHARTQAGHLLCSYQAPHVKAPLLVLVGLGEGRTSDVGKALTAAWGALKSAGLTDMTVCFAKQPKPAQLRCAIATLCDATYVYTHTKPQAKAATLKNVSVAVADANALRGEFDLALAQCRGAEFAKEWANRPANHATPRHLADAAKSLAKKWGFKCEALGPKDVEKLGMGAFMAVAKGSEEPLRLIVLRYDGAAKSQKPTVLVGKGITFDTGGISLKPAPDMDEMKFDMSGAASVLGVFRALGELKPAINVVGVIAACENMPDGRATKPGDVVTSMDGQTIEILNTDAEGRLVLCDALTYAKRFKPRAMIDIATLTGACVIALGAVRSGLFSNEDALRQALSAAGERAQDRCWPMPLDDEYAEGLKTNFADVANVAGRAAGSVTAAKFLQRFVGDTPWAHLDIAGSAWKSGTAKSGTGRPVGLLLEYLLSTQEATADKKRAA